MALKGILNSFGNTLYVQRQLMYDTTFTGCFYLETFLK